MATRLESRVAALEMRHSRQASNGAFGRLIPLLEDEELVTLLAHLERVAEGESPSPEIFTIIEAAAAREGINPWSS